MLGIEVLMLSILIIGFDVLSSNQSLNIDDICLRVQAIVIVPSEFVYAEEADSVFRGKFNANEFKKRDERCIGFFLGCLPCCCCNTFAILLSSLCYQRVQHPYGHPSVRIGLSMVEWIFVIIWGLSIPERGKFLFLFDYGLAVFIVSGICYFIHTQYIYFFPDFSLPGKVSIRSIYGYAFNGELEELQRVKTPKKFEVLDIEWDDDNPANSKLPDGIERDSVWGYAFYGDLEGLKEKQGRNTYFDTKHRSYRKLKITPMVLAYSNQQHHIVEYIQETARDGRRGNVFNDLNMKIARSYLKGDFWDIAASFWSPSHTPAMYALSMGHYHVVEYLEQEKGAKLHRDIFNAQKKFTAMNIEFGRTYIGQGYFSLQS